MIVILGTYQPCDRLYKLLLSGQIINQLGMLDRLNTFDITMRAIIT